MFNWQEWKLPLILGVLGGLITGVSSLFATPSWITNALYTVLIIGAGILLCLNERFLYSDSFKFGFVKALVWRIIQQTFREVRLANDPEFAKLDAIVAKVRSDNPVVTLFSILAFGVIAGALIALLTWGVVAATSAIRNKTNR